MPVRIQIPIAVTGLVSAILLGIAAGLGAFTFAYAKGASYLQDDPAACANCHVMEEVYSGWLRASHRSVAVCNDCHTPSGFVGKYLAKARNGWHHSVAFTSGDFHEPIQITASNRSITEARCRSCHAALVAALDGHSASSPTGDGHRALSCIPCHRDVGHPH